MTRIFVEIRVGVVGDHCHSTPRHTAFFHLGSLPLVNNSMSSHPTTLSFPVLDFSPSIRLPWNQVTTTLRNCLNILYLFTYSDYKTVLIPVVCPPSHPCVLNKSQSFYRPPLLTSQPTIQVPIVFYARVSGHGSTFSRSASQIKAWI